MKNFKNKIYIYTGLLIIILSSTFFIYNNIKREQKGEEEYFSYINIKAQEYYDASDYSNSILLYNKLIKLDSIKGNYYFNRASCFFKIGKYELSIKDLNQSIILKNKMSKSHFNLGLIYMLLQKDTLAYTNFSLAYKYNPFDIEAKSQKDFFEKRIKQK
jgi:tetratricopeptide (TPR) repeat protein